MERSLLTHSYFHVHVTLFTFMTLFNIEDLREIFFVSWFYSVSL